jgi:hypothetical protein
VQKIGLILITLLIVCGTAGVAYSAWTSNVVVSGTINTGRLDWSIEAPSCWDYDKALDPTPSNWPSLTRISWDIGGPTSLQLKDIDPYGNSHTLSVIMQNAYPGYAEQITFNVRNTGTFPLKFEQVAINESVFSEEDTQFVDLNGDDHADVMVYWDDNIGKNLKIGKTMTETFTICVLDAAPEAATLQYTIELLGVMGSP